jgi:DNA (cytosine-5)-methyltransferase 1
MTSGSPRIPVIDIFAGPGGLSEGFWRTGRFDIRLSIEKDVHAYETLKLRAFVHQFDYLKAPDNYYRLLAGEITAADLYRLHRDAARAAESEAWLAELGSVSCTNEDVDHRIAQALKGTCDDSWILIGGPPCQAYSLVGRSRRRRDPNFEKDPRHVLYRQYLRILARHGPAVFVMENVAGILTTRLGGTPLFPRILEDLKDPGHAAGLMSCSRYRLFSLRDDGIDQIVGSPANYVVRAEDYGIPQARHRVIIVGVRENIEGNPLSLRKNLVCTTVGDAIDDLLPLRSRLSKENDGASEWLQCLKGLVHEPWFTGVNDRRLRSEIRGNLAKLDAVPRRLDSCAMPEALSAWIRDKRIFSAPNHEARSHMRTDLWRYFYAAVFASVTGRSPNIGDFPDVLRPLHANLQDGAGELVFADRFRVQLHGLPSTTVTSHISKDGHYYIHPDPLQCRSLTVREAARLQTFPDNYLFCGPRTEQYRQVGNAVPPLLAYQIAEAVSHVFKHS